MNNAIKDRVKPLKELVKALGRLIKHARYYWLIVAGGHLARTRFALTRPINYKGATDVDEAAIREIVNELETLIVHALDIQRCLAARHGDWVPEIRSFDDVSRVAVSVMSPSAAWMKIVPEKLSSPGMISTEEAQYYEYIGSFYEGVGRAVELGSWLGASTHHIVRGLRTNPNFANEKLHVFDDFVWRTSWMDQHVSHDERLPNHSSFLHLFEKYTKDIQDSISVHRVKITDYDGNEELPLLSWDHGQIELLYVDCGRTFEANQAWYNRLRSSFIPNRTLIMMQDWRLHRELPRKSYNQTLLFTESKGSELRQIHEVTDGGLSTFLFSA
jgi:hypothetical protein